jgi:hypothetical protein
VRASDVTLTAGLGRGLIRFGISCRLGIALDGVGTSDGADAGVAWTVNGGSVSSGRERDGSAELRGSREPFSGFRMNEVQYRLPSTKLRVWAHFVCSPDVIVVMILLPSAAMS